MTYRLNKRWSQKTEDIKTNKDKMRINITTAEQMERFDAEENPK